LRYQNRPLFSVLSTNRLERMITAEITQTSFYSASDMVRDLRKGIFSEVNSDIHVISRGKLEVLKYEINLASKRAISRITKYYYKDCLAKIDEVKNPKKSS